MHIREATKADIPNIVSLLQISLGEALLPKSEKVWNFKHFDNPFGKSLVLVATDEKKIIGVRAFMRWNWHLNSREFKVYRAVDTAVHPEYQGRGIFRNLNTKAVELAEKGGNDFIFNTPNSKSLPGNLKLGWREVDKIQVQVSPSNPLYFLRSNIPATYSIQKEASVEELDNLIAQYNQDQRERKKIFTPKSLNYLEWRYEHNPLQSYEIYADKDLYLAGYLKAHKFFVEFRITEHIFIDDYGREKIKKKMKELSRKFKVPVISYSAHVKFSSLDFGGNFGPILTFRNLQLDSVFQQEFFKLKNWNYTLGDLELF